MQKEWYKKSELLFCQEHVLVNTTKDKGCMRTSLVTHSKRFHDSADKFTKILLRTNKILSQM
ncbi:hypothetical protein AGMMS49592_6090 [Endomicrobiia bacterium]|nr:hypothetical protein AGMMS49592_6090 [Endomicrobiia bacterium]